VKRRRYWSLEVRESPRPPTSAEAEARIRELLDAAVKRRLMSEVPLGVFLSGGIDSSSVVASAAALGVGRIRTFSIGFGERSFDETEYAREVARRFGTEHVEERLAPEAMLEIVPRLGEILDEPMADGSIVPTFLLSRLARRHVTVALGGDGGDELFAGYPMYVAHRVAGLASGVPSSVVRLAERAAALLPVSHRNLSLDFKVKKTLEGLRYPLSVRNYVWLGAFAYDRLGELLEEPLPDPAHVIHPVEEAYRDAPGPSHLEKVLYQDIVLYLCHHILCKVDRASMANSLEVRAPFLDTALAEYVARLPLAMKLDGLRGKAVLKRAMAERLPRRILHRPKSSSRHERRLRREMAAMVRGLPRRPAHTTIARSPDDGNDAPPLRHGRSARRRSSSLRGADGSKLTRSEMCAIVTECPNEIDTTKQ
jgi:asparagine synthase (glutamine-hydrolysing)